MGSGNSRKDQQNPGINGQLGLLENRLVALEKSVQDGGVRGGRGSVTQQQGVGDAGELARLAGKVKEIEQFMPQHCTAHDDVGCIHIDFEYGMEKEKKGSFLNILCMVLSTKREHQVAVNIKNTWGAKCNQLIFLADYDDPSLPAVDMKATWEGSGDCLIDKIFKGWQYVHDGRLSGKLADFDFVLKADVDSMPVSSHVSILCLC
jgi:hypothetical protein